MKVIAALGNPGNEYNFTRHNFGFLTLDFYAKINGFEWKDEKKFNIKYFKEGDKLFVKPLTFYNEVGQSFESIRSYYKLTPQDFLVVCDDFNLEFGKIRYRERGSAGGNNGLKSTITHFHTDDFPRLRLGSANDNLRKRIGDTDFVLSKFTDAERGQLPQILKTACNFLKEY